MHELSVTQSILDIVRRHAEQAQAKRVVRINLVIGELSGFVDESIQFYFDFLSRDTPAAGAELAFTRPAIFLRCGACGHEWHPTDADWTCPQCNANRPQVLAGREFYVDSIEIE